MGEKESEVDEAVSIDSLQQSLSLEEVFNGHNKSSSRRHDGRPFLLSVEEAHRGRRVTAFEDERSHTTRPRTPTPESGRQKKAWTRRKGFTLFNFRRSRQEDRSKETLGNGNVPPLTNTTTTLTDVDNGDNNHVTNLALFHCVNNPATAAKNNGDLASLRSLSPAPELVPFHDEDPAAPNDLSSLYCILNNRNKGVGDFTSITFESEELSAAANVHQASRPNTQEHMVKPQLIRPLTRDGGRPPTGEGKALFMTSKHLPAHILPPLAVWESSVAGAVGDVTNNLESWMTNLPPSLKRLRLNYLFIPGSHDSFSYTLTPEEEVGPDAPNLVSHINSCVPCIARPLILRWSVTQRASTTDQLTHGIRYFDIRVAVRGSRFYFVHGLYGEDLTSLLSEIRQFLVKHPGEVVLLDFQHFHGLTANDHLVLVTYIKELFTDLICPYFHQLDHLSLAYLARFKYQVLVFYRHTQTMQNVSWLWSGASLPNPWPDTTSITSLLAFLEDKLRSRSHNTFFVTQCVLTPTGGYLARNMLGHLEKRMAAPINKMVPEWLESLPSGLPGANVIMTDFVDHNDWAVPKAVVSKNTVALLSSPQNLKY